ncbi:hypothetical protein DSO57_1034195 [Entomophthora muscae]|uniref:Uncharacterized protein n=1 Tax=Entomophthora muscae TaxID=34485 RepID=A0ACC2TAM2_9FUNG|nr:hypothetical protein DSO57_1034195 [Entomophthora muscae]
MAVPQLSLVRSCIRCQAQDGIISFTQEDHANSASGAPSQNETTCSIFDPTFSLSFVICTMDPGKDCDWLQKLPTDPPKLFGDPIQTIQKTILWHCGYMITVHVPTLITSQDQMWYRLLSQCFGLWHS